VGAPIDAGSSFLFLGLDGNGEAQMDGQASGIVAGARWARQQPWIEPVSLAYNLGYRAHELTRIEKLVAAHAAAFLEAWHDYFRTQGQ
jgi:hypothetical protein